MSLIFISKTVSITLHTIQMLVNSHFSAAVQCWRTTSYPQTRIFLLLLLDLKKRNSSFCSYSISVLYLLVFLVLFDEIMKREGSK